MMKQTECGKLSDNNIVVSNISMELLMENTAYQQLETKKDEMKVVLEFPDKIENEEIIKEEVKSILADVLQERFRKMSTIQKLDQGKCSSNNERGNINEESANVIKSKF